MYTLSLSLSLLISLPPTLSLSYSYKLEFFRSTYSVSQVYNPGKLSSLPLSVTSLSLPPSFSLSLSLSHAHTDSTFNLHNYSLSTYSSFLQNPGSTICDTLTQNRTFIRSRWWEWWNISPHGWKFPTTVMVITQCHNIFMLAIIMLFLFCNFVLADCCNVR